MTQQEYLQLAQNSESVKMLPKDIQDAIMKAEGPAMESYGQLLMGQQRIQEQNRIAFINKSLEIYNTFSQGMKEKEKQVKVASEAASQTADDMTNQLLINDLDNEK